VDRRANYLTVALELFVEHGFHGVSMDQIVAAAGGSKATLYRYFDSKESLFAAIIDDVAGASTSATLDDTLATAGLEDGLRLVAATTASGALHPRTIELLRLAVGESRRFPELAATLFARGPGANYERLRHFIEHQQAIGAMRAVDAQIAAEQLLGGIVGHQQLRLALGLRGPTRAEIDARVDAAVATFVATYGVPPRQRTRRR
jgi:AcrR family transcriptional regulator